MSEEYHYPVVVEIDEDGIFIVSCPTFKACHANGLTIDAALNHLSEVIEMCLEDNYLTSLLNLSLFTFQFKPKNPANLSLSF